MKTYITMEKSNLNYIRELLYKMLAIEAGTKPYYKELQFFKNQSEWPTEW
jgi:hypothetical protein